MDATYRALPALSTPALDTAIDREDEHPFADLHIDIGKKREGFGPG